MLGLTIKDIKEATSIPVLEEIKERLNSIETEDKVYMKGIEMYQNLIQKRIETLLSNKS